MHLKWPKVIQVTGSYFVNALKAVCCVIWYERRENRMKVHFWSLFRSNRLFLIHRKCFNFTFEKIYQTTMSSSFFLSSCDDFIIRNERACFEKRACFFTGKAHEIETWIHSVHSKWEFVDVFFCSSLLSDVCLTYVFAFGAVGFATASVCVWLCIWKEVNVWCCLFLYMCIGFSWLSSFDSVRIESDRRNCLEMKSTCCRIVQPREITSIWHMSAKMRFERS